VKIIVAPDSFKNCLRSKDVCLAIEKGIKSVLPDAEIILIPMADGGEGTAEAVVYATGGHFENIIVTGPLGEPVNACYGVSGDGLFAVMEMASASGIELLDNSQLNPMKTTTFGTGEILRAIIKKGIKDIVIGIGGSATVDGGTGMAQALGFEFYDAAGIKILSPMGGGDTGRVSRVDSTKVEPSLRDCRIRVACDVTNPLTGANGAAEVFGPQKGATGTMVAELDKNLNSYAKALINAGLCAGCDYPGDGAAGGMGFALRVLTGATMISGAELMAKISGLERHLCDADLLITGEGCTDSQTANGKLCAVVAGKANCAGVPVVLLSGAIRGDIKKLDDIFAGTFSIARGPCTLSEAIIASKENLFWASASIARLSNAFFRAAVKQ
jgi:glycerate kinase